MGDAAEDYCILWMNMGLAMLGLLTRLRPILIGRAFIWPLVTLSGRACKRMPFFG